jgi:hypothetical protein
MKKFLSIFTVVTLVCGLTASAYAAGSPYDNVMDPYNVNGGGGPVNDSEDDDTTSEDNNTTNDNTGNTVDNTGNTTDTTGNTTDTTGNTNNNTGDGAGNDNKTDDTKDSYGNISLKDLNPEALAYKIIKLLIDNVNATIVDFLKALDLDVTLADQYGLASTVISVAKGLQEGTVSITENEDGTFTVTCGNNQNTLGKAADALASLIIPNEEGKKAEVVSVELDENGNLSFKSASDDILFTILVKKEA